MMVEDLRVLIGNTPLVRLKKLAKAHQIEAVILAKVEGFNPFGSIKDRAVLVMLQQAEKTGALTPETTIIEATSGNTGIALAGMRALFGYQLTLVLPDSISEARLALLKAYGAKLVLTPAKLGMDGAIKVAETLVKSTPNSLSLKQFRNPANPQAHRLTAVEILADCPVFDYFVAGVGTAGTLIGVAQELKNQGSPARIVAVEPNTSAVLSGQMAGKHQIPGLGAGFIPPLYRPELVDEVVQVDANEALEMVRQLALLEGLLVGVSAGAALVAALKLAQRETAGKTFVVILPDRGERYLSAIK